MPIISIFLKYSYHNAITYLSFLSYSYSISSIFYDIPIHIPNIFCIYIERDALATGVYIYIFLLYPYHSPMYHIPIVLSYPRASAPSTELPASWTTEQAQRSLDAEHWSGQGVVAWNGRRVPENNGFFNGDEPRKMVIHVKHGFNQEKLLWTT